MSETIRDQEGTEGEERRTGWEEVENQQQETGWEDINDAEKERAENGRRIEDILFQVGDRFSEVARRRAETFRDRLGDALDEGKVNRANRRAERAGEKSRLHEEELEYFEEELEGREAERDVRDYQRRAEAQIIANAAKERKEKRILDRDIRRYDRQYNPEISKLGGSIGREQNRLGREDRKFQKVNGKLEGAQSDLANGEKALAEQIDRLDTYNNRQAELEQALSETNLAELKMRLSMTASRERRKELKAEIKEYKARQKELKQTGKSIELLGKSITETEEENTRLQSKVDKIMPKYEQAKSKVDTRTTRISTLSEQKDLISAKHDDRVGAARANFEMRERRRAERLEQIRKTYPEEIVKLGDAAIARNGGVARGAAKRFLERVHDNMQTRYDQSRWDKQQDKKMRLAEEYADKVSASDETEAAVAERRAERAAREEARIRESLLDMQAEEYQDNNEVPEAV